MRKVRVEELGIDCPICHKPDWCRVSEDGKFAICSRVPIYSQGGTLHKLSKKIDYRKLDVNPITKKKYQPINWNKIQNLYSQAITPKQIQKFGQAKGLSYDSLVSLGIGFDDMFYTFPLYDCDFLMVGIQRQNLEGKKLMVKGSHNGIFLPRALDINSALFVTEGASDCAAALDLGLNAIGKLNNTSGNKIVEKIVNKFQLDTYIIADNDKNRAGQNGAFELAKLIRRNGMRVKIIIPPCNDLREWKNKFGLTRQYINKICRKLAWYRG